LGISACNAQKNRDDESSAARQSPIDRKGESFTPSQKGEAFFGTVWLNFAPPLNHFH
jgi:hypothetical protein